MAGRTHTWSVMRYYKSCNEYTIQIRFTYYAVISISRLVHMIIATYEHSTDHVRLKFKWLFGLLPNYDYVFSITKVVNFLKPGRTPILSSKKKPEYNSCIKLSFKHTSLIFPPVNK